MFPLPDARGRFGPYGGRYVPETLIPALDELETGYRAAMADPAFRAEVDRMLRDVVGRPSMLTRAERLGDVALADTDRAVEDDRLAMVEEPQRGEITDVGGGGLRIEREVVVLAGGGLCRRG